MAEPARGARLRLRGRLGALPARRRGRHGRLQRLGERAQPRGVWRRYFETLGEAARSGLFDILAHPDLVKIWGRERPAARGRPAPLLRAGDRGDRRVRHRRRGLDRGAAQAASARSTRRPRSWRCASRPARRSRSRATPTVPRTSAPDYDQALELLERARRARAVRVRAARAPAGADRATDSASDERSPASAMTRHRLVAGRRLCSAASRSPSELGLDGHSDADVLTHAVIDALLGAAGLGDIGEHFPDTDERWRDADSIELLRAVVELRARRRLRDRQRRLHRRDGGAQARRRTRRRSASGSRGRSGSTPARVNVKATHRRGDRLRRARRGRRRARRSRASIGDRSRRMREIRLHDTRTRRVAARSQPRDAGRVGIYACGPTVYSRIHVGNARPFVVFSLLKRFLEHEGYAVTLVINITDVNDKIYDAARAQGRPSAELAQEMTAAYRADTDALGLGRPDHEPLASRDDRGRSSTTSQTLVDARARLRGRTATSTSACAPTPATARSRTGGSTRWTRARSSRGRRAQGGPARLRAVEGAQAGRGHRWDSPWGRGPAGLAHRVLGDGRGAARRRLRHPRRRLGPGVPPPRERGRPDARGARASELARLWMHNGMIQSHRREDGQVGRQHRAAARGARPARARGGRACT